MNYDNLHNAAEILEAFQGCRDAGEQIDLFEALAWRDDPPVKAFIEIVQEIKLESVLALAVQALGWVKNAEVRENWKKSNELLGILSNLATSGATDLIKWSAAKSIIAIGFDFISVSQHLTEMPGDIIKKIYNNYSKKNTGESDSINFWVYGDTLYFCSIANNRSLPESKLILKKKGVRGINEINLLLKKTLKNGSHDISNVTNSVQQVSQERLLNSKAIVFNENECEIMLSSQIYCVASHHIEVRKAAIGFLCENSFNFAKSAGLKQSVNRVNTITKNIIMLAKNELEIDVAQVDKNDIENISKIVDSDFLNKSNKMNSEYNKKIKALSIIEDKINHINKCVDSEINDVLMNLLVSPILLGVYYVILIIAVAVVRLFFDIFRAKDIVNFLSFQGVNLVYLIEIISFISFFAFRISQLSEKSNEKEQLKVEKNHTELEKVAFRKELSSLEDQKAVKVAGVKKIENLLREREKAYELLN
jgi:hypothetical protein